MMTRRKGGWTQHLPYLVWSYDYSDATGGPKVLHRLCHELNEAGERAYIGAGWTTHPEWNTPTHEPAFEGEWIAVYPEIVRGNPWKAPRVARWALNVPGLLGGDTLYDPSEMVFTFDASFKADAPLLFLPVFDTGVYVDRHEPRTGAAVWVGKATRSRDFDAVEITPAVRADPRALVDLLNRVSVLYSFDAVSGMNYVARLCGAQVATVNRHGAVIAVSTDTSEDFRAAHVAALDAFRDQLGRFVEITQRPRQQKTCAVIPTRFHPPELDPLLAVLGGDGVCVHLIVDPDESEHRIYNMWNQGADEARAHGATHIAVLNDDITLLPGTLPAFTKAFTQHEATRRSGERPLGLVHPHAEAPWGSLPNEVRVEESTVLTGCCFFFRADVGIRFDESYRWWYGDNQFDDDLRAAGWLVARVVGVPYRHRPETSTRQAWDYLAPFVAQDRELYDRRHPPKPPKQLGIPSGIGTSYR